MATKFHVIPYFDEYSMSTDMTIIKNSTGEKLTEYPDAGIPYVIIDNVCIPVSFLYVITFIGIGRFPIVPDKGGFTYKVPKDIIPLDDGGYIIGTFKDSSEFTYFRTIPGFSQYLISPYGLIFSIDRYSFLHQTTNHNGYRTATITDDNGFRTPRKVHRLVYLAYNGPIGETSSIDHINNKRWDNYCGNLQELKTSDNALKIFTKGYDYTDIHWDDQIIQNVCKSISEGKNSTEIATSLGITPNENQDYRGYLNDLILNIRTGKAYKDIMLQYVDSIENIPRKNNEFMLNGGKYTSYSSVYTNPPDKINRAYKEYQYRLTPKDVTDIRERMARGEDPNKLAEQYKCKPEYIRAIYKRVTWKNV